MRYATIGRCLKLVIKIDVALLCFSCSIVKHKQYSQQYKIIDYIFPHSIDSLLTVKLRELPNDMARYDIVAQFSTTPQDTWYDMKGERSHVEIADYELSLLYIPKWHKKSRFSRVNSETLKYAAKRTNRFAVINKGEFVIPIVFFDDVVMMGRGYFTKPPTTMILWPYFFSMVVYSYSSFSIKHDYGTKLILKWENDNVY